MKHVAIVGFGRFGEVLYRLLKDDFELIIYNRDESRFEGYEFPTSVTTTTKISDVYKADTVFFAVSISSFDSVIKSHKKYFKDHLLVDVLSVKVHPKKIFQRELKESNARALLTHPMFGPDSSKNGFDNLPMMLDKFLSHDDEYEFWKAFFESKNLRIVEMTADEHDKLAANSQGVTHFVGRLLADFDMKKTSIDTNGAKKLLEVMELTVNDTWELFDNLQTYNPYTKKMRIKLGKSYDKVYNKLLPEKIIKGKNIFGIQGGKGSFNEQAINHYIEKEKIQGSKIVYLYTTENVLSKLHEGEIDFGQFAIENSIGGLVEESIQAMSKYKFRIVREFAIPIQHFMMIHKNANLDDIDTVMSHPQVFKQCASTLKEKFKDKYNFKSGDGELIDHAKVAEALSKQELDSQKIAVLGPRVLADIYDLTIVAEDLQDDKTNNTRFLVVKR